MIKKLARLFVIKTRFEAFAIIYGLALGQSNAVSLSRRLSGWQGYMMFLACTGAVFIGGGKILDATARKRKEGEERRNGDRRNSPRLESSMSAGA
jgi:hypothetical protein